MDPDQLHNTLKTIIQQSRVGVNSLPVCFTLLYVLNFFFVYHMRYAKGLITSQKKNSLGFHQNDNKNYIYNAINYIIPIYTLYRQLIHTMIVKRIYLNAIKYIHMYEDMYIHLLRHLLSPLLLCGMYSSFLLRFSGCRVMLVPGRS